MSNVRPAVGEYQSPPDLTPLLVRTKSQYSAGGSFGDVYKCCYFSGSAPKEVAVKAFRFKFTMEGNPENKPVKMLRRELGIWRRLKHNNIVPFLGIAYGFGMDGTMSLVSSWMPNESLHKFLAMYDDNINVQHRLQFLLDIAKGLKYLHSFPIVHGDLNCNNVLLDADCTARLADFGYASLLGNIPEALSYLQRSTARPGALRWIAPEQIDVEETFTHTTKSDIYSFGCVALQVLSGKQPWSEVREDAAVVLRLAKGRKPGRPTSRAIYDAHWDLIQNCWSPMDERPAAQTMILSIQQFLDSYPPSRPLCDLLVLWSSQADPEAKLLSPEPQVPIESATTTRAIGNENEENRVTPSTPSQDPSVGTDAPYTSNNYTLYGPAHDPPTQPLARDANQDLLQNIITAHPTLENLTLDGERTKADAGQSRQQSLVEKGAPNQSSFRTPSNAQVYFSSDVRNMDDWARRTGIPLTTAEALGTTYARAHKWLLSLKSQLIQQNGWWESLPADHRMLFSIEAHTPWRSPSGLPRSPKLKLQLPMHASSFFSPERRVQWQMVFHSDVFATQRLITQPISDVLNLIQCLFPGLVTIVHKEQVSQGWYTVICGLPSIEWTDANQAALLEVFGRAHVEQLRKAVNDHRTSFKVDFEPRQR